MFSWSLEKLNIKNTNIYFMSDFPYHVLANHLHSTAPSIILLRNQGVNRGFIQCNTTAGLPLSVLSESLYFQCLIHNLWERRTPISWKWLTLMAGKEKQQAYKWKWIKYARFNLKWNSPHSVITPHNFSLGSQRWDFLVINAFFSANIWSELMPNDGVVFLECCGFAPFVLVLHFILLIG